MTKLGVFVYQGLPFLIDNVVVFTQKEQDYVKILNDQLKAQNLDWEIRLDDSEGDIQAIEKLNPQVLILKNGLQRRFNASNFDQQRIYQLGALEFQQTRRLS